MSAIRGEGQYRGPIQIQSNALDALEAIDLDVADQVMRAGCITSDRINGLVDGVSGSWQDNNHRLRFKIQSRKEKRHEAINAAPLQPPQHGEADANPGAAIDALADLSSQVNVNLSSDVEIENM
ncbi:hypothetical protein PIB30_036664 [Stylosanthes scabra]|uniref:Uncharacterized protein n=1 Tax=Stylosanthes scabra TaxID=79078 RepID=A0ABU6WGY2_9FABA|nr:hypothetical protein [Stylosanthes scabra]